MTAGLSPAQADAERAPIIAELRKRAIDNLRNQLTTRPPSTSELPTLDQTASRAKAAAEAVRQGEAVKQLISDLQLEKSLVGASAVDQRVATELRKAGSAATDDQRMKIEALIRTLESQKAAITANKEAMQAIGGGLADAFGDFLTGAKSADDAVRDLIGSLAKAAIQAALIGQGPFGGVVGGKGIFGSLFGFDRGGYTGDGARLQPAGVVHRGEYVFSATATRNAGVANLEGLHDRLKGYAGGGHVGALPTLPVANDDARNGAIDRSVTIHAPVTVNATGGTAEANAALARQTAQAVSSTIRSIVSEEIRNSMRPGNPMNSRAM